MFASTTLLGALAGTAMAGTVLWDGRFNDLSSSSDLNLWSFSNEVGPYQYYIHGDGNVTEYVNLDASYKNPADTVSKQGVKMTIDNSSHWDGQTMLRTELIPQTKAAINAGKVFYHFSMQHTAVNPPDAGEEHQVCFFESHFTEMKYGLISGESGTSDTALRWDVGGVSQWNTTYTAGVWHNIAYAIDFDAKTVGFYHSTGADDLQLVVPPVSASTSSNGADWHLGILRLPATSGTTPTAAEDWYFSGVYVESGDLTTSVSGAASSSSGSSSSSSAVSAASSTSAPAASSSTSSAVVAPVSTSSSSAVVEPASTSSSSSAVVSTTPVSYTSSATSAIVTPSSTETVVSSVTVVPVSSTFATSVRPSSSSSVVAPVSSAASSSTVAPVYSSSSSSVVVPVSTSSAVVPLSTGSSPTSSVVAPVSTSSTSDSAPAPTSTPDGDCEIEYVYV